MKIKYLCTNVCGYIYHVYINKSSVGKKHLCEDPRTPNTMGECTQCGKGLLVRET